MKSNEPRSRRPAGLNKRVQARKAIIILGMHRSGTSALSNLLIRLGGDGPATPMPPNEDNQKGHFESQQLYLLHDALLDTASSSWDDYRPIPEGWAISPKADEFRERLRETILSEYGRSGFFVVKDPRICRMVPFWRQTLDAMKVDPLFVHTHRNPIEVAGSLQKRNGFDFDYGCLVWLRHILDAEAGSRGQIRSFTSYDRIIEDWPGEVAKIATDLHISWPKYSVYNASELNDIIEPGLKRQTAGVGNLRGNRVISRWISDVHMVFDRWAATGERADDHQALDDIRSAFDESISLFHGVVQSRGRALTGERDAAHRHATEVGAHSAAQQQVIEALTGERDAAHRRATEIGAHSAAQDEVIEALTAERDAHIEQSHLDRSKLAQNKAELDDVWQDLNLARGALGEAEEKLSISARELEQGRAQVEALRADNARYDAELAASQAVVAQQLEEIAVITVGRENAQHQVAEADVRHVEQEAAIAALSAERDDAYRQIAEAQAHGLLQEQALAALAAERDAERIHVQHQVAEADARHVEQEAAIAALSAERDDAYRQIAEAQAHGLLQEQALAALAAERDAERIHVQHQVAEADARHGLAVAERDNLAAKIKTREAEQAAVTHNLQAEIDRLNDYIKSTTWSKITALYQDVHRKLFK